MEYRGPHIHFWIQVGGPWREPGSPMIGKIPFGYTRANEANYDPDGTRCYKHVVKALSMSAGEKRSVCTTLVHYFDFLKGFGNGDGV